MIGIRVVPLVRYIFNQAEALPVNPGKPVAERLSRSPVKAETEPGLFFPALDCLFHAIHHAEGKFLSRRIRVADPFHQLRHLIDADISQGDRGVSVMKQRINLRPLRESGNGSVLPVNRTHIR